MARRKRSAKAADLDHEAAEVDEADEVDQPDEPDEPDTTEAAEPDEDGDVESTEEGFDEGLDDTLALDEAELEGDDDDGEEEVAAAAAPADDIDLPVPAALDEDAEDVLAEVVEQEQEQGDVEDALREGEFICRSCFLVKGPTQLADSKRQLCRDCV